MQIRQANIDDAQKFIDYLAGFWSDGCDTVPFKSSLPDLEQEKKWLSAQDEENNIVFIAEQNNQILGMLDAGIPKAAEYRHTCEFGMSVLVKHRNKGIGRMLLQNLFSWAEERDIRIVGLEVYSNNTPAIALYSSFGFKEDGRKKFGVKLQNGEFCDLIHMSKYIAG